MADGFCKKYIKVAYSVTGPREAVFSRLRCKQWTCDYCSAKNASIWRAHLLQKLPLISDTWWLVTFTAHAHRRSAAASLANIRDNLEAMLKRIKRTFGKIEYVRVYEKHPSSLAIHAHLIITGLTPYVSVRRTVKGRLSCTGIVERKGRNGTWAVKTWFKKNAQDLTMGYMVDVQKIDGEPGRAIWYVTKYLTKDQQALHIAHLRHVQVSQGIGGPKNENDDLWQVASYITSRTFSPGTKVLDLNTGRTIDNNYWEVHDMYPYDD